MPPTVSNCPAVSLSESVSDELDEEELFPDEDELAELLWSGWSSAQSGLVGSWMWPDLVMSGWRAPTLIRLRTSSMARRGAANMSREYVSSEPF